VNVVFDAGAERNDFGVDGELGNSDRLSEDFFGGIEITMNVSTSLEPMTLSKEV
jgi:hypothetical protein